MKLCQRQVNLEFAMHSLPHAELPKPRQIEWQESAAAEEWGSAVLAFLRAQPRQTARYWQEVNSVVGESRQASRWQVRSAALDHVARNVSSE